MKNPIITPSLFYQFASCPHWIWFDRFANPAEKGEVPALAQKLLDQGVVHEFEYVKNLDLQAVTDGGFVRAMVATNKLMQEGAELIYQGAIETDRDGVIWRGRPDLLRRVDVPSNLGAFSYIPIDIKSSHSLRDTHALQLGLYALVLEAIQGVRPAQAGIINVDHEEVWIDVDEKLLGKVERRVEKIIKVIQGEKPPMKLGSKCKHSPWFKTCIREAEEANDIALIYNIHPKTMEDLRALGIQTVSQFADADLETLPKISHASGDRLYKMQLQARALLDGELHWLQRPEIPHAPLRLYFDIEGDPLLDVQYLFGFWVVEDGKEPFFTYFLAEKPEDEGKMWKEFMTWIETLPTEYLVYHFADYERARTLKMAEVYGGSQAFSDFAGRYVDLSKVVQESVIFPLYFYSIKDIAKSPFLKYRWRHQKAGGAQSIFWYEEWLETGDRGILQDIIDYNEDDVIATEYLHSWLVENRPNV